MMMKTNHPQQRGGGGRAGLEALYTSLPSNSGTRKSHVHQDENELPGDVLECRITCRHFVENGENNVKVSTRRKRKRAPHDDEQGRECKDNELSCSTLSSSVVTEEEKTTNKRNQGKEERETTNKLQGAPETVMKLELANTGNGTEVCDNNRERKMTTEDPLFHPYEKDAKVQDATGRNYSVQFTHSNTLSLSLVGKDDDIDSRIASFCFRASKKGTDTFYQDCAEDKEVTIALYNLWKAGQISLPRDNVVWIRRNCENELSVCFRFLWTSFDQGKHSDNQVKNSGLRLIRRLRGDESVFMTGEPSHTRVDKVLRLLFKHVEPEESELSGGDVINVLSKPIVSILDDLRPNHRFPAYHPPVDLSLLRQHQRETISWMVGRETMENHKSTIRHPLWCSQEQGNGRLARKAFAWCPLSGEVAKDVPTVEQISGGILADEMGLGKTLCVIALIRNK